MAKKIVFLLLSCLILFSHTGCKGNQNLQAVDTVVRKIYNVPSGLEELLLQNAELVQDEETFFKEISALYEDQLAAEYLPNFYLNTARMYDLYAAQHGSKMEMEELRIELYEDNTYRYYATVLCTDSNGSQTQIETSGSARTNEKGLVVNVHPHPNQEIMNVLLGTG